MSIQSIVRSSLVAAGIFASSATVFARQPPSLANAEKDTNAALCSGARAVGGAGYRDASIRFAAHRTDDSMRSATAQSGGYRDAHARLGLSRSNASVVACTTPAPVAMRTARR
jgi:hypothetical protein